MANTAAALEEIISAIGEPTFPARAGHALSELVGFDLIAILAHRPRLSPAILFENFDRVGCRAGIELYACSTHRINPMLQSRLTGPRQSALWRACDFKDAFAPGFANRDLVPAPDEELGYRTVGWPARHEEIGAVGR
jgi:hypothetical protein